ncbi:MAG: hypothetical protein NVSMB18_00320 [Acetobacteraceae bacterium]
MPLAVQGLVLVNARINGGAATMVLDTGASRSIVTPEAAKRLGITSRYDFATSLQGIEKVINSGDARLNSFVLAGQPLPYPRVLVGPVALSPAGAGSGPDGLLGADLLADYDVDIDVPGHTLAFYDRTQCEQLQVPWTGSYVSLQTSRALDGHPFFPIELDGHKLTATIDSGAQRSVISTAAAAGIGVAAASAADRPQQARGAGGEVVAGFMRRFRSIGVGGQASRGPELLVANIAISRDIDVVLGLDYLRSHRIWISYGSRRLLIAR